MSYVEGEPMKAHDSAKIIMRGTVIQCVGQYSVHCKSHGMKVETAELIDYDNLGTASAPFKMSEDDIAVGNDCLLCVIAKQRFASSFVSDQRSKCDLAAIVRYVGNTTSPRPRQLSGRRVIRNISQRRQKKD